jgi:hypothetical protein
MLTGDNTQLHAYQRANCLVRPSPTRFRQLLKGNRNVLVFCLHGHTRLVLRERADRFSLIYVSSFLRMLASSEGGEYCGMHPCCFGMNVFMCPQLTWSAPPSTAVDILLYLHIVYH